MTQHDHGRDAFIALLLAASAPFPEGSVAPKPLAATATPCGPVAADPARKSA